MHSVGLQAAQGLYLSTPLYWNRNDDTRAFAKEIAGRNKGVYPTAAQAGVHSAILHYAKAAEKAGTDDGRYEGDRYDEVDAVLPSCQAVAAGPRVATRIRSHQTVLDFQ